MNYWNKEAQLHLEKKYKKYSTSVKCYIFIYWDKLWKTFLEQTFIIETSVFYRIFMTSSYLPCVFSFANLIYEKKVQTPSYLIIPRQLYM